MHQELKTLVDDALAHPHALEAAWQRLSAAIDAEPAHAGLRRLRVRLAEAARLPEEQLTDLRALHRLAPDDREATLALACLQHRCAGALADTLRASHALETAWDDPDTVHTGTHHGRDAARAQRRLEDDAVGLLAGLVAAHTTDANFLDRLFDAWQAHELERPWTRLRLVTQALAAHPSHRGLRTHLAQVWVALAAQAPSVPLPPGGAPVGFAVDAFGGLQDALITRRALAALDELIADDPAAAPLLEARGRLGLGCSRFDSAAQDFRAAALLYSRQAMATDDRDHRDTLMGRAEEAAQQARRCAGGREACVNAWMQDMHRAMGRIAPTRRDGAESEVATDAGTTLRSALQAATARVKAEWSSQLAALLPQARLSAQAPDSHTLARMRHVAGSVAERVAASVAFAPAPWALQTPAQAQAAADARLLDLDTRLRALGLRHLAWADNPAAGRGGRPHTLTGVWVDADGHCLATATVVGDDDEIDLHSELSDARQVVTTAGRGRQFMEGGPMVDQLLVDVDQGLPELLALHRARVALTLSQAPELSVRRVQDATEFVAMQERQRRARAAWRLQTGLSEFEALALPADQPEHFVPLVREAARDAVARAHAAWRRRQPGG